MRYAERHRTDAIVTLMSAQPHVAPDTVRPSGPNARPPRLASESDGTAAEAIARAAVDGSRLERRRDYAAALAALMPEHCILATPEALRPYESDGLTALSATPLLVVLPETVEQVQALMRWARERGVPVVARGAGTGLSGGALPHEEGILLGLARFSRILELDPERGFARVEPGVRNLAISDAARPHGLYYAPDPSSQIACSIGGNVAENSGGVHCLKYGLTVHNVLALKVVTIDGDLIEIGGQGPDAAGYDLLALLTGSEGMLAITVEVTVKLLPEPPVAQLVMAAFASVQDAGDAVGDIIAAGIVPAGLELMDAPAIQAAEAFARCGYPARRPRPCCCASSTAWPRRSARRSSGCRRSFARAARRRCTWPRPRPSGCSCGRAGSPPSPPSGAWRRTTTASTAPSRAASSPTCSSAWSSSRRSTSCRSRTSSTPATATFIR